MTKKCCTCEKQLDLSCFSKNKGSKDGLCRQCKACAKAYAKAWRKKNNHDGRIVANKRCSTCNITKSASDFNMDKSKVDGLASQCKSCKAEYKKNNRDRLLQAQREQNKKMAERTKIQVTGRTCSQCKEYKLSSEYWKSNHTIDGLYSCCIECKKKLDSTEHRRSVKYKAGRKWYLENKKQAHDAWNDWDKNKRRTSPEYKLRRNVMHAIVASVKNRTYNGKLERLQKAIFDHLPYTSEELIQHIESKWESWMSWDNYGKYDASKNTWQIDHIIPQSKLPYESLEDENFKKCWSLGNLQPLETIANIKKGNKIIVSTA